jgi:hypothetical protein
VSNLPTSAGCPRRIESASGRIPRNLVDGRLCGSELEPSTRRGISKEHDGRTPLEESILSANHRLIRLSRWKRALVRSPFDGFQLSMDHVQWGVGGRNCFLLGPRVHPTHTDEIAKGPA